MSLFSLTKVIPLAKAVSRTGTFGSIITPLTEEGEARVEEVVKSLLRPNFPILIKRYMPWISSIPLSQGMTWAPTWKSLPNYGILKMVGVPRSPYLYWPLELKVFGSLLRFIHSYGEQFSPLVLWPHRVRFAFDKMNSIYANQDVDKCESSFAPHLPTTDDPCKQFYKFGRLGQATEGRAKRRIFAIGNYVNQRLLKPVMNWLMEVLRRLPPDGTFHQTAPLSRIKNRSCYYSYDLTAATDRMPLRVLFHVMATLFSPSFASACVNSVLAMNLFEVPFVKGKDSDKVSTVSFVVAAEQVYPGKRFLDYSLLGDDIVIADERVAIAYRAIMSELQVGISDVKS
ncbi:hypothetical protein GUJ93_ZPchr0138g27 [Zizania palustris]|uniref:Uncharacterized protein n=1 Tax=Zizania palustris TaxID=103762 RepID=A0A8J5V310_ZIZPA|nr:hypothetical protein GUJ93_ZPchr0138g27 [Zizania palustris]